MCIRALDYCPPVDISFGDYLRAIVTADYDLVPDDDLGYRIAFIEAFRRRGIYPRDVRALSVESLRWQLVDQGQGFFEPLAERLRKKAGQFAYFESRQRVYEETRKIASEIHDWIEEEGHSALKRFSKIAGITFSFGLEGLRRGKNPEVPSFELHSLRPARRVGPDGESLNQLIMSFIQSRDVVVEPQPGSEPCKIVFRGGCSLILDLDTMKVRYAVTKDIAAKARVERYKQYRIGLMSGSPRATYYKRLEKVEERFAMLHRSFEYGRP